MSVDTPLEPTAPRRPSLSAVLVISYLLLLGVSHVVRLARVPLELPAAESFAALRVVDGERLLDERVGMSYADSGPQTRGPAVILLHGSPGSKHDFDAMSGTLEERHRVIAPDLPGFGASRASLPDYSIRAHARYVLQLMDELEVERAHLVGFSMGGGVALNLYELAPRRVLSLSMLSAIGVQELELFGDYRLNRFVHSAQLAALWLVREGLPHMGLLDDTFFDVAYARNFYDSDQRPLREILRGFQPPMLILHGDRDFLVPPEVALEHRRIVPHSELKMVDGSHFLVFLRGQEMARQLDEFLARVDSGDAPNRPLATVERLALAAQPFDPSSIPPLSGVGLALILFFVVVATLVSEDLTCIAVGLLVAQGRVEFFPGVAACFVGIYLGDLALFLAGRLVGRPALARAPLRWLIRPENVEISSRWFARRGAIVIGLSRFMPGARLPTYFAAGLLRTSFWSFSLYFFLAVAVWTPLLVGLAMLLGERTFGYFESFQRHVVPALILLGFWILVMIKVVMPLFSYRGRRRMAGRLGRILRWEFWPPWLFYPPVVARVLWLGLRHRSPLLFTAANPAMPAGGFIAESKWEILQGLGEAEGCVARTGLLPPDDSPGRRVARARALMAEHGLEFPVVLKPDAGQRGSGVAVIRSDQALKAYLDRSAFTALIQEYVPGCEFGLFYYRHPDRPRGRLFSITEKRMPQVVGDGRSTVEQLILRDRRAVRMADHYLRQQLHQLERVPPAGEQIALVELGTHCLGAIFLDGSGIATEDLLDKVDRISRGYAGFFFGRYDVRVPDVATLQRGTGFKIIELNGVTSEATHIYDPRVGLVEAYRTLFEQWSIAFEIGRLNRRAGHAPARLGDLLALAREYRATSRTHPK